MIVFVFCFLFGCIVDDFIGVIDFVNMFVKSGMCIVQMIGVFVDGVVVDMIVDVDVIVVVLKLCMIFVVDVVV